MSAVVPKPKPAPEAEPFTKLVALLDGGDIVGANELTHEIGMELREGGEEFLKLERVAAVAAKIKQCWIYAYRKRLGEDGAANAERLLAGGKVVVPEAAIAMEQAKAEPEAKPKPADLGKAKPWPDAPKAPVGAEGIERLTYPEGLLGHVVQYIMDSYRLPDRLMALTGAIFACTIALARKVLPPGEISLALYILVIAQSGAGKQHILNCLRILLRAMGREDALVGSGIASVQSIDEILEGTGENNPGRPLALVSIDEYGSFLTRIGTAKQVGNISEIPGKLQTLWAWPPDLEYQGDIKVGKKRPVVHGPAFLIFGTSTESSFFGALKQKNFSSGFVNRHLVFNAGRGALKPVLRTKYKYSECPTWLVQALKEVAGDPAPRDNRPLKLERLTVRDFRRIGWGPGAEELFYNFEVETRAIPSEKDREVWIRAPEIALRLATVHAVFRGSKVIEERDAVWAMELARASVRFVVKGTSKHMLEEYEQADLVEYIRDEFRRKGVLTQGQIRKLCERKCNDHRKIDFAIHHLLVTEEIVELEERQVRAGRPTHRYEWMGKLERGETT